MLTATRLFCVKHGHHSHLRSPDLGSSLSRSFVSSDNRVVCIRRTGELSPGRVNESNEGGAKSVTVHSLLNTANTLWFVRFEDAIIGTSCWADLHPFTRRPRGEVEQHDCTLPS